MSSGPAYAGPRGYPGKRLLDLALVLGFAPLWVPLFACTAVLVALFHGAPIFFTQTRPGLGGEPFRLIKFRTMREAADDLGRPLPDRSRMTRLGRILRATGLDELPELAHVLTGQMSLVGPRPLLMEYLGRYDATQARRHEARPGLTGWAQVHGRNTLSWQEVFRYDVWYVDHASLWLDMKILAMTVAAVFRGTGATAGDGSTRDPFMGNPPEQKQHSQEHSDT